MPRRLAPCLLLLLFAVGVATPASAALIDAAAGDGSGTDIGSGIVIHGAVVTCPGDPVPRSLNGDQAAAFIQSWLPYSIFGKPQSQKPPASIPVCHILVSMQWNEPTSRDVAVFYATDGTTVWVGMPPQTLSFGVFVSQESWIQAPDSDRTMRAFAGLEKPVPVSTPTTAEPRRNRSSHGNSSSTGVLIALIAGSIVVIGAATFLVARARTSRTPASLRR